MPEKMTPEKFNKRYADGADWSREEFDAVVSMLEDYGKKGHEQCPIHDHMYDSVVAFCISKSDALTGSDVQRRMLFVRHIFDIALGMGMELGMKQAIGQSILTAIVKGDEHEKDNTGDATSSGEKD